MNRCALVFLILSVNVAACGGGSGAKDVTDPGDSAWNDGLIDTAPDQYQGYCSSHDECGEYLCDPELHRCVECISADDCEANYACKDSRCVKKGGGCQSDAECTALNQVCDEDSGECVDCITMAHCPSGQYCLNNKCSDWICTPGAKWCNGTIATVCEADGSAISSEVNCVDETVCTAGDECANGECIPPVQIDCDDDNVCTEDFCDPVDGCLHTNNSNDCEDGTDCTKGDKCVNGICLSGPSDCECSNEGECVKFDDGDLCNGILACTNGLCVPKPNSTVKCPTSMNPCNIFECVPDTGLCVAKILADNSNCDDSNECTENEICLAGVCTGDDIPCNDNNDCTVDSCNPDTGCVFIDVDMACNDGLACTGPDFCKDGVCLGGVLNCEDGNVCTKNWCDETKGGCQIEQLAGPCEDGSLCTENEQCVAGVCKGDQIDCSDDNQCTNNSCDPELGCVVVYNSLPCDDANPCTINDHCLAGQCVPGGTLYQCDDLNDCTTDSCNIDSGECIYTNNTLPCTDNDPCTIGDVCSAGICKAGDYADCDDNNICTTDYCDADGICRNLFVSGGCNDGNPCTGGDQCVGGICKGTFAVSCDDGNNCTTDSCIPSQGGCVNIDNSNPCNDNNMCTLNDHCEEGVCKGGEPLACDQGNPCTLATCLPLTGCNYAFQPGPCEDGNLCTFGDYCAYGACMSGGPVLCDDLNVCTNDSCVPDKGCVTSNNSAMCEDGNPCTYNDKCDGGFCKGGPVLNCDDNNPCTTDICNYTECLWQPAEKPCDDETPCTFNDHCESGFCIGTQVDNCGCHSLHVDGNTAYVVVENSSAVVLGTAGTVEFWFKPDVAADAGLVSKWGTAAQGKAFRMSLTASSSVLVDISAGGAVQTLVGSFAGAGWHHAALVVSGTNVRLFIDGNLKDSKTITAAVDVSTANLLFGARYNTTSGAVEKYYAGFLDEIRVSKAAVYPGTAAFEPLGTLAVTSDTIACWHSNQNQFVTLFDSSPNYLHGKVNGTIYYASDTVSSECIPLENYPPSTPVITVSPANPGDGDNLICQVTSQSVDIESDPVTYKYEWYKNGVLQNTITTATVPAASTNPCPHWQCGNCEVWTCKVTPKDQNKPGLPATASVTVGAAQCVNCLGTVFNDHCYLRYPDKNNWQGAIATCGLEGAYLVTITSVEENNFVYNLIAGNAWIGASDTGQEGSFTWQNGEPFSYTRWGSNQPNDGGLQKNQDCVILNKNTGDSGLDGKWNDTKCDNDTTDDKLQALEYVCEQNYPE